MLVHDIYHEQVKHALIKDGWTITVDPLRLSIGPTDVYIDLGAERTIAAEKGNQKIAVEIQTFQGPSNVREFEVALGQFILYRAHLSRIEPDRKLYLAVPKGVYDGFFGELVARIPLEELDMPLIAFDPKKEMIVRWRK